MSLDEESLALEEEKGSWMLGRCFHGEMHIWTRSLFGTSLMCVQKTGAIMGNI